MAPIPCMGLGKAFAPQRQEHSHAPPVLVWPVPWVMRAALLLLLFWLWLVELPGWDWFGDCWFGCCWLDDCWLGDCWLVEPPACCCCCGVATLEAAGAGTAAAAAAPEAAAAPADAPAVPVVLATCIMADILNAACVLAPCPGMLGLILNVMPLPLPQCGLGVFCRQ